MSKDIIRRCRFTPYRKGMGPTFALTMWDTGRWDHRGCPYIGYRLTMNGAPLFEAEDYSPGAGTDDDSDACVAGLMGFLTCKPGDTDAEFFKDYTSAQLAYAREHADALNMAVIDRFGEF